MAHKFRLGTALLLIVITACDAEIVATSGPSATTTAPGGTMNITSPAFSHNGFIPDRYTCEGEDISPPLEFDDIPTDTISLVLIIDDPDAPDPAAPKVVWEHWVMWNIAPGTTSVPAGSVPAGAVQGTNSWGRTDYGGPCPPVGTHRYFIKLYALDTTLAIGTSSIKADVEVAMQGHVLAQAELIGRYGG